MATDRDLMGRREGSVVSISGADGDDVDEPMQDLVQADDPIAMKEHMFNPLPDDPKILVDDHHTWTVEEWRSLGKKERSPIFEIGGIPWRILLFPYGNNVDHCSVYLEHGYDATDRIMPPNWSACVQFGLVMWNPKEPTVMCEHTAHHRFTKEESDWGFTRFLEIRRLLNPATEGGRPYVEDDRVNITAYVRIVEDETGVLWHNLNNYDSKIETGFVGLKNQGATCYLNSLLQSLYVTNAFRKAIYEIPTESEQSSNNSAYSLQRLFYMLQTSDQAVSTLELTKSFGWDSKQVFEQQDVQELSRKLMERMEEKMKGTKAEKVLPDMFSGKIKTYISCINVNYESSRIEDFWDIQLNVSGNKNLEESFRDYVQVEKLDGDNQYFAGDEHQLQDAKKGVIFTSFPDVLHLQLKRFEYDFERDALMKINDRHEFPEEFDAAPYLSEDAEKTDEPWTYQLHGVLVHSGVLDAGHYYAYLKPNKDGWFYRFDDDKVVKATRREVLEENYGGAHPQPMINRRGPAPRKLPVMRMNSAYMLVYIRKSRVDKILCDVRKEDIPAHIKSRYQEELALREAKRKEREEAHLYLPVRYTTLDTFKNFGGTDLCNFDQVAKQPDESSSSLSFKTRKVLRTQTVQQLRDEIGKELGVPGHKVRLWQMVNRQNKTTRPDTPLMDNTISIEEAWAKVNVTREISLRLFVEIHESPSGPENLPWPSYNSSDNDNGVFVKGNVILLFLKCFDVASQTLRGVGHVYVERSKRIEELYSHICNLMGWPANMDEKIHMWEEIKPNMIEALKPKTTFAVAELVDGDIICFQRTLEKKGPTHALEKALGLDKDLVVKADKKKKAEGKDSAAANEVRSLEDHFDDAPQYYDFLCYRKEMQFAPHVTRCDGEKYPPFSLNVSAKISYDDLVARIGHHLGVPGTHIRLWTINPSTGNPKTPVRRTSVGNLQSILSPSTYQQLGQSSRVGALYFEVLEMSLAEMDMKKNVKLVWLPEGVSKEEAIDVLVNKNSVVQDVIEAFIKKSGIASEEEGGPLRIFEVNNYKFYRELRRDFPALTMNEYTTAYIERIPEEERAIPGEVDGHYMNAFHFHGEPARVHGVPFRLMVIEDEPFSETKKRLEKRTGFKGKSFEKIKFALIQRSRFSTPEYLCDDDVLSSMASLSNEDALGLDHPDRTRAPRTGGDLFLN